MSAVLRRRVPDRPLRVLATVCLITVGGTLAANGIVGVLTGTLVPASDSVASAVYFPIVLVLFALAGWVIVRRRPRNRIGWLLVVIALGWVTIGTAETYALVALSSRPGSLPGGTVAQAVYGSVWLIPVGLMGTFLVLLYPDGRLPSRRWRPLAYASGLLMAVIGLTDLFRPGEQQSGPVPGHLNPLGIEALRPFNAVTDVLVLLLPVAMLASAVSLALRFRRARGVERLQLKWLATAGVVTAGLYLLGFVSAVPGELSARAEPVWHQVLWDVALASFGLVPLAIGVAITRHGLYGIDRIINRALVVGTLGLFITAVYVAVVVGVGALVGRQGSLVLSVVATAAVAVAFQPVRERVQRLANRLVYGRRATPYEVLSDFATNLSGTYTTGELLPRLARTVSDGLGGAATAVWVREAGRFVRDAAWPAAEGPAEAGDPADPGDGDLPDVPGDRVVPVRHRGDLLGVLTVTKPAGERMTPPEDALLEQVASQAGLVLRNVRLLDDLKRSRERLVATQDETRRRLERNLHDGAQQSLVSVNLLVRMAAARAKDARLEGALTEAAAGLQTAIDQVRELARGIHPAVLTERGLTPALTSLAERSRIPVTVQTTTTGRADRSVETTLYVVAAEAIANAARHSGASSLVVSLGRDGDDLVLTVTDDGRGGADPDHGTGLRGLTDRVAVADGTLDLHSPPGSGTRITCHIPAPVPATEAGTPEPAAVGGAR